MPVVLYIIVEKIEININNPIWVLSFVYRYCQSYILSWSFVVIITGRGTVVPGVSRLSASSLGCHYFMDSNSRIGGLYCSVL